jgi:hypothetical protein
MVLRRATEANDYVQLCIRKVGCFASVLMKVPIDGAELQSIKPVRDNNVSKVHTFSAHGCHDMDTQVVKDVLRGIRMKKK